MRAAIAISLLLALAIAAPGAQAGGQLIPLTTGPASAPAFAGDDVVWAGETQPGRYLVERLAPDGTRTTIADSPAPERPEFDVAASPERVAVSATDLRCDLSGCRYMFRFPVFNELLSGPPGSPLERVSLCESREHCRPAPCAKVVAITGHSVLLNTNCRGASEHYAVRDFAGGPELQEVPDLDNAAIAGNLIAGVRFRSDERLAVEVYDWRQQRRLMSLPIEVSVLGLVLRDDGTVVFDRSDRGDLAWAAPGDPRAHPIVRARSVRPLRIVGDRVLYADLSGRLTRTGIADLQGQVHTTTDRLFSDYDGRRLAGSQRPCGIAAVFVWDLEGEPPRLPSGRCPPLTIESAVDRLGPKNTLMLTVGCPAEPALGCAGNVEARAIRRRRGDLFGGWTPVSVRLEPGERRDVSIPLRWRSVCGVRRGRLVLETRTLSGSGREPGYPRSRTSGRLTATGGWRISRSC